MEKLKENAMKRIICIMMAFLMIASVLIGCNTPDVDTSGEFSETPSATPVETTMETDPPIDPIILTAEYVIVRPELCSDYVEQAVKEIKNALSAATGANITVTEDFLYGDKEPAQYEILVGLTNREESARAADKIKYYDYTVTIDGDKLVVCAYSDEKLFEAVEYTKTLIEKSLVITESDIKTVCREYELDTVSIGGIELKGYTLVISKKAGEQIKSSVSVLQERILELSGIYLPIKIESKTETEKEILIGDTERAESKAVNVAALGEYGFAIKAEGSKIVIKTNDMDFALMKTINNISEYIKSGSVEEVAGELQISEEPILTTFMFTDVHNNFAMLEPTNNYGNYIVRKNVDRAIDLLLETVGPVDVVQVGGDLMSDYHSWYQSGCWPYKYFVEYRRLLVDTFKRLSKDGKVVYAAGNHDYAQGELATDGPGTGGTYNSFDFYFGDAGMRQDMGELNEEDMFVKIGEHTGEKYLLAYYYEVNGVGFVGLSPDHDMIWSDQGNGFDEECLAWLDRKLDEVDPYGNKVIFVNCHYCVDHRKSISDDGTNTYGNSGVDGYDKRMLAPVFAGHKNLYHIFGHAEIWYSDTTVRYVTHHNSQGNPVDVTGKETDSTQVVGYANRDYTTVYGGHFRPDANEKSRWFEMDFVTGYAGTDSYGFTHRSTCTPRVAQGMYIEVYEDRIVFTMKNFGDVAPFSNDDLIVPYTVYLYK